MCDCESLLHHFSRRINVPTIARQMNDRGFAKSRKGKKRITTYTISKRSKVIELMNYDSLLVGGMKDAKQDGWEPWFQQPVTSSQN